MRLPYLRERNLPAPYGLDRTVFGEHGPRPVAVISVTLTARSCPRHDVQWYGDAPCFVCESIVPTTRETRTT